MKSIFIGALVLILITLNSASVAQINVWRFQNPNLANDLEAVQMISLTTTYACGHNTTFTRTTDGGVSWETKSFILGQKRKNFYGISFLNEKFGMICGDSGSLLKTTDGGTSWKIMQAPNTAKAIFTSIAVVDTNIAIVIGKFGLILRTIDGGDHWSPVPFEISLTLTNVRKLRPNFLTAVGYGGTLIKSVDSGRSWQKIQLKTDTLIVNNMYGQVFFDDNHATLIGELGMIIHTKDGGKTWIKQQLTDSMILTTTLHAIDGKNFNVMACVGDYGYVIYTSDEGTHWTSSTIGLNKNIHGISFFDKLHAMAVGAVGIALRTSDGGVTWEFMPQRPMLDPLSSVVFPKGDTSLGFAVGYWGTILRTTNGGTNWNSMPSGTRSYLRSIAFLDPNTLVAVGDFGTIVKSTDKGLTWALQNSPTSKHLLSVTFGTKNSGWACGDSAIVISTTNGGLSWTKHPFPRKLYFPAVSFSDSLHGYLGSSGSFGQGLFITTDGGANWDNPDYTYYDMCYALHSPSPNTICIIGYMCPCTPCNTTGGHIRVSHDGGLTWETTALPLNANANNVNGVFFCDDMHGTVVAQYGNIFHTKDGGKTWSAQTSNTFDNLYGVCFGNPKAGTAVGVNGDILRITTDE
jgi:photosystem II stability/assembly factor-like uncharacterized protein